TPGRRAVTEQDRRPGPLVDVVHASRGRVEPARLEGVQIPVGDEIDHHGALPPASDYRAVTACGVALAAPEGLRRHQPRTAAVHRKNAMRGPGSTAIRASPPSPWRGRVCAASTNPSPRSGG